MFNSSEATQLWLFCPKCFEIPISDSTKFIEATDDFIVGWFKAYYHDSLLVKKHNNRFCPRCFKVEY